MGWDFNSWRRTRLRIPGWLGRAPPARPSPKSLLRTQSTRRAPAFSFSGASCSPSSLTWWARVERAKQQVLEVWSTLANGLSRNKEVIFVIMFDTLVIAFKFVKSCCILQELDKFANLCQIGQYSIRITFVHVFRDSSPLHLLSQVL